MIAPSPSRWTGAVRLVAALVLALALTPGALAAQRADGAYAGYAVASRDLQRRFENRLQAVIDTAHARTWSRVLSAEPHVEIGRAHV